MLHLFFTGTTTKIVAPMREQAVTATNVVVVVVVVTGSRHGRGNRRLFPLTLL